MGWMYPALLPPTSWRVQPQIQPTFFSRSSKFDGNQHTFFDHLIIKEREWNQTSALSFLKDDFIPELVVSCTGHTVASIKEVYFYACWMMYKRNIFQRFPSPSELAIHNDWNRGEWIPKPSSFKSRGIHATYESVFQEEQEPRHLCDLAETDPFYQNTGNRKTWIIWSHCIWWAYTLSHTIGHAQPCC